MELNDVTNTGQVSVLNANFDLIEQTVNEQLIDRENVGALEDDVDMNGFRIYNLPKPVADHEPARLKDLKDAGALTGGSSTAGVSTFNTRDGDVVLTKADVETALGYEPVKQFSPAFTGTPIVPTAPTGNNSMQIASTAFVQSAIAGSTAAGVSSFNTRTGAVTLTSGDVVAAQGYTAANINSPAFTGVPTAPTASNGTNTTQLATTAFVQAALSGSVAGVASFNTRTGTVTLNGTDVTGALGYTPANIASPTFTGVPAAPTATAGTNTTQIATTAFVKNAVDTIGTGVASFNTRTGTVTLNAADVVTALETGANAGPVSIDVTAFSPTTSSFHLNRTANYSGGQVGWVNSALFIDTTVSAGATSFEWGLTSRINNSATGGENVGAYLQGNKLSTGPTWGGVTEVCDMTNSNTTSSSGGTVGLEVDVWCNGSDNFEQRVGIDVVVGNAQLTRNGVPGIGKGIAYDGIRILAQGNNNAIGAFRFGLNILSADDAGILNQANGIRGIFQKGTYQVGIDLAQSTNSDSAIRIKSNDWIALDENSQYKLRFESSTGRLQFYGNGANRGYINLTSGTDTDLASGGGGGSYVDLSTAQAIAGIKTFSNYINANGGIITNGIICNGNLSMSGNTVTWTSSGNIRSPSGSVAGQLRIIIDGNTYWLPFHA